MAQHLRPGRQDNRGGHRKKTSTKIKHVVFIEESKKEELDECVIRLNEEVKNERLC